MEDGDDLAGFRRGKHEWRDGDFSRASEDAGDEVVWFQGGGHSEVRAGFFEGGVCAEGFEERVGGDEGFCF